MKILVPLIVLFVTSVFIIELFVYAYKTMRNPHRKVIQRRLKTLSSSEYGNDSHDITRKRLLSRVPLLNTILLHTPGVRSLERLLQQANVQSPLGVFILLAAVLALTGYLAGSLLTINRVIPLIIAASLAFFNSFRHFFHLLLFNSYCVCRVIKLVLITSDLIEFYFCCLIFGERR